MSRLRHYHNYYK